MDDVVGEFAVSDGCAVYVFRTGDLKAGSETIVTLAPREIIERIFGGGGAFGAERLAHAFGGAVVYRHDETGVTYLGVWGSRNGSRLRSVIGKDMPVEIKDELPPARLVLRSAESSRSGR